MAKTSGESGPASLQGPRAQERGVIREPGKRVSCAATAWQPRESLSADVMQQNLAVSQALQQRPQG